MKPRSIGRHCIPLALLSCKKCTDRFSSRIPRPADGHGRKAVSFPIVSSRRPSKSHPNEAVQNVHLHDDSLPPFLFRFFIALLHSFWYPNPTSSLTTRKTKIDRAGEIWLAPVAKRQAMRSESRTAQYRGWNRRSGNGNEVLRASEMSGSSMGGHSSRKYVNEGRMMRIA